MRSDRSQEAATCRSCGGLIRRQNARCNRCGAYTNANAVENFVLRSLVPDQLSDFAATTLILTSCVVTWLILGVVTRGDSFVVTSGYTLLRFGATHGPLILAGEVWRVFTANFLHHDILHLAMNMYALLIVGRELEARLQRHAVLLLFILGGAASMAVSWLWYVYSPAGSLYFTSAGASGGVCALIGGCWAAARYLTHEPELERAMLRWSFIMLIFGFIVSGVNNAAHIGGWVAGAGVMMLWSRASLLQRFSGTLVTLLVVSVLFSAGLQIHSAWGLPPTLEADAHSRSLIGLGGKQGVTWERSSNLAALRACEGAIQSPPAEPHETVVRCKYALYATAWNPMMWQSLAIAYARNDEMKQAERAAYTYQRLLARMLTD